MPLDALLLAAALTAAQPAPVAPVVRAGTLADLEALARAHPADADALRRLGAAYAAAGRYRDAQQALDRAQRLAPADRDIAFARARVASWSGAHRRARRLADGIAAAEPGHPELAELRRSLAAAQADARGPALSASHGRSRVAFAGRRRRWTETAAAVSVPLDRNTTLGGEVEHADRGFAADTRLTARVDARLGPRVGGYLGVAVTPDADFRERWSVRGGGEAALTGPLAATLDLRLSDFGAVETLAIEPGLRVALRPALDLAGRAIILRDGAGAVRAGGAARLDGRLRDGLRAFGGAATYPDTEAGITRQVRAAFVGLAWNVGPAWTLRATAEHERREASYRRTGLVLGLSWRPGPR